MSPINDIACEGYSCSSRPTSLDDTSAQRAREARDKLEDLHIGGTPRAVYIVTDTCYPSAANFDSNRGVTSIIGVYSSSKAANQRAKKIIYENERGCAVDIDKIIEEERNGLYTGIGVGGKEEREGCCFARKCEVEVKIVDDNSDDEAGEGHGESSMEEGEQYQADRGRRTSREASEQQREDVEMG